MQNTLDRILTIHVADPDDTRRRRLLNVLLLGVFASGVLVVLGIAAVSLFARETLARPGVRLILPSGLALMLGTALIYAVNRRSGRIAAFLFLLLLTLAIAYGDTPLEVATGRSLFFFAFPVAVSSLVIFPAASFLFAAFSGIVVFLLALSVSATPNVPAIVGFFMLALVSWLSSRGMEQAIEELRAINLHLDSLVGERTKELAESLGREQAEAAQREAILNSIADGVIVFDRRRVSTLVNPAIEGLLGIATSQIVGHSFDDLAQSPVLSARDQGILAGMAGSGGRPGSFRIEWGKRTLSVSAAPVQQAGRGETGTVSVFRDVTREAELERMKSAFVAIVSHELRTPLNAIIGFAEMIKEAVYGPVNEKQMAASDRIMINGRHMLGMVGDLLDQAQIEAGKLRITSELFEPTRLVEEVKEVMGHDVEGKGLALTTQVDPRLPQVLTGDAHRLQQILINLVNNATKFTETGEISVHVYLADPKHWALDVRDTGRGIPPEAVEHVFDPFYQVDSTTTRAQGGFGLGLSIVSQLVHLMKGRIDVQSTLGQGTTFSITLPLTDEDLERKQAMSHTALIIEDDSDLAAIFAEALKSAGFESHVIRDGAVAQQRIREVVPHIVILDLHLPHVDGATLLSEIRSDERLKGTIVIIATADAIMGDMYRDKADIVLIKPISFTQLRDLSARLRAVQPD